MQQKENTDKSDDQAFFKELFFQGLDGVINEHRPVVSDRVANIARQTFHGFIKPLFHIHDHLFGVGAVSHDHDAAYGFAFAVKLRDATSHIGPKLDASDLPKQNGHAVWASAYCHFLQVLDGIDVAAHP